MMKQAISVPVRPKPAASHNKTTDRISNSLRKDKMQSVQQSQKWQLIDGGDFVWATFYGLHCPSWQQLVHLD